MGREQKGQTAQQAFLFQYEPDDIQGREKDTPKMGRQQKARILNAKTPSRGPIFGSARTGTLATQANQDPKVNYIW